MNYVIDAGLLALIILLWRKLMTSEESALSAIAFVKQIILEVKAVLVEKIIPYEDEFAAKLQALVDAVAAAQPAAIPATVTAALSDLVDTSKNLSAAQSLVETLPEDFDAAIAALTP